MAKVGKLPGHKEQTNINWPVPISYPAMSKPPRQETVNTFLRENFGMVPDGQSAKNMTDGSGLRGAWQPERNGAADLRREWGW